MASEIIESLMELGAGGESYLRRGSTSRKLHVRRSEDLESEERHERRMAVRGAGEIRGA